MPMWELHTLPWIGQVVPEGMDGHVFVRHCCYLCKLVTYVTYASYLYSVTYASDSTAHFHSMSLCGFCEFLQLHILFLIFL